MQIGCVSISGCTWRSRIRSAHQPGTWPTGIPVSTALSAFGRQRGTNNTSAPLPLVCCGLVSLSHASRLKRCEPRRVLRSRSPSGYGGGAWSSFTATLPALQAQEPRQLTSSERSARRLTLVLCPASSTLIRTSCPGSSTSWPIGRRRVPEVAPPPSGTDGRSLVSPELCVAWDAPLDGSEVRRRRRIKPEALNMNFYTKRGRSSQSNTKLQLGGCDMIIYDL